ncbi:MAG: GNAT family N-acetyltransferase [Prolixibacteraceae bacterium]|nr:GNAT family N-acetyltransferase [Prolixibacteraceae bacterium]
MKEKIEVIVGDIQYEEHANAMLNQLDLYMQDPMGGQGKLSRELASTIVEKLKVQSNYLFFLAKINGKYAGFANCFIGFSTFQAKQLLNIHDFAVSPVFRRKGIGDALMKAIIDYSKQNDMCKITLEVRQDNPGARSLYKRNGFSECAHPMFFWERLI